MGLESIPKGYYPYPYSQAPLPVELHRGLYGTGLLGLASTMASLALLTFIIYRMTTWQRHYRVSVNSSPALKFRLTPVQLRWLQPICCFDHESFDSRLPTSSLFPILLSLDSEECNAGSFHALLCPRIPSQRWRPHVCILRHGYCFTYILHCRQGQAT